MPRLRLCLFPLLVLILLANGCAPVDNHPSSARQESRTIEHSRPQEEAAAGVARTSCPLPENEDALSPEDLERLHNLPDWMDSQESAGKGEAGIFPVKVTPQVSYFLDFYANKRSKTFAKWLTRSGRYLPMIREELQKAGLPLELAYLPMIESGFTKDAKSPAGATGLWQFMEKTGRRYGLAINPYVDQRLDPVASTQAAILYLGDLYREFGTWPLAVAGYNAGNGTVRNALEKTEGDTFWDIAKSCYLREETKLYVPKLMAAILISSTPGDYGFDDIFPEKAEEFETVEVPPLTSLEAMAVAGGFAPGILKELNAELRQAVTPPEQEYAVKVPAGSGKRILANLPRVKPVIATDYATHVVASDDTVASVCRRYNLNTLTLLKANNLRRQQLAAGQRLRIPVQTVRYVLVEDKKSKQVPGSDYLVLHTVKPGETLSAIALQYNVTTELLTAWNDIKDARKVRAGSQLALYLDNGSRPLVAAQSKSGGVHTKGAARAGEDGKNLDREERITFYQVRQGDSLWKIGRRFNLPAESIRRWNRLEGNTLRPGTRLKIKLGGDIDA